MHRKEYGLNAPSDIDATLSDLTQLLRLPDIPARLDAPLMLRLVDYTALLMAADAVQSTGLRARLARSAVANPVLTPDLLESELEKALSHSDHRWAGVSGGQVCPAPLNGARGQMGAGLAALQAAGLVMPVSRGQALTEAGYRWTNILNEGITTAGWALSLARADDWRPIAHATVFAGEAELWVGSWTDPGTEKSVVHLKSSSTAGLWDFARGMLALEQGPSAQTGERRCPNPQCGKLIMGDRKFCTACSTPLPPVDPGPGQRVCPNPRCGKPASARQRFCTACASPLAG